MPLIRVLDSVQPPKATPVYRTIVAVDIEGSTRRINSVKERLRWTLYELFGYALVSVGIVQNQIERLTDRGDGILALIRPDDEIPKTLLLDSLVPELTRLLADYNERLPHGDDRRLRLRMVIHAGEVLDDGKGFFGESLDVAFRLLDAPVVKKTLRQASAPLVLVVSEEIFSTIIQQGHGDSGGDSYRIPVRVRVGGVQRRGRIHLPTPTR